MILNFFGYKTGGFASKTVRKIQFHLTRWIQILWIVLKEKAISNNQITADLRISGTFDKPHHIAMIRDKFCEITIKYYVTSQYNCLNKEMIIKGKGYPQPDSHRGS